MGKRLLPPSDLPDPGETSGSWEPTDVRERRGEGAFLKETEAGEAGEAPVPAVRPTNCETLVKSRSLTLPVSPLFNPRRDPSMFLKFLSSADIP